MASSSDKPTTERSRRRQPQAMATQGGDRQSDDSSRQTQRGRRVKSSTVIYSAVIGSLLVIFAVATVARLIISPDEPEMLENAIWLDKSWTYASPNEGELADLAEQLRQNQIGTIYAYVSTLNTNNLWAGGADGRQSFIQSQDDVVAFKDALKQAYPESIIYGWIEIWAYAENGEYRLDDSGFYERVADFSHNMIEEFGFDGVLLDVKPLFGANSDFFQLIRDVRSAVDLRIPIAVVVSPDLNPIDAGVASIPEIAPETMWTAEDKQQALISANEVVLQMYQSYRSDPLDYIHWVAYHVESYLNLLHAESITRVLVSIPHYQAESPAHDLSVETIAAALDGVRVGLSRLDEERQNLLTGVAIYTDRALSQEQWDIYHKKWLSTPDGQAEDANPHQTPDSQGAG